MSVPSMFLITWNRQLISFGTALVHLGLSVTSTRCQYYWDLTVSRNMKVFMCPGWIVNSWVASLVITQFSTVWRTKVDYGKGWYIGLGSEMMFTWFAMRSWPWRRL